MTVGQRVILWSDMAEVRTTVRPRRCLRPEQCAGALHACHRWVPCSSAAHSARTWSSAPPRRRSHLRAESTLRQRYAPLLHVQPAARAPRSPHTNPLRPCVRPWVNSRASTVPPSPVRSAHRARSAAPIAPHVLSYRCRCRLLVALPTRRAPATHNRAARHVPTTTVSPSRFRRCGRRTRTHGSAAGDEDLGVGRCAAHGRGCVSDCGVQSVYRRDLACTYHLNANRTRLRASAFR
ncbi:hypothetical protein C8Q77DRAFT_365262 [Trametes polyzona]|nr:hypothetical protein C8Q77DRAFT_365262 [Trametes polyzona]